ncbi:molecular chaperone [Delphinella strobiligena]|nr:molecular chaperone [Delphinella strobiligena]
MSTEYNYDDQGQFFPFFFVTVAGLVTLPVTYSLLRPSKAELENTAPRIQSSYEPEHADLIEGQRRRQKRRERKVKRMIVAASGWAFMGLMIYLMSVTARSIPQIWDPYEILGIPMSATEKQIQSRYRRLSITMHPDKAQPDASKNETFEMINERWVEVIKAYKALTDEEIRNNFQMYGNPDGKQSTSFGIALPQFLVSESNGKYILLIYGALLGVLLPYFVGRWWYGSRKLTKEKVLVTSAGNIFKEYNERIDKNGVISVLSSGAEYDEILKGHKADTGSGQLEKRVLSENKSSLLASAMTEKDRRKVQDLDDGVRRKTLALLWAYLGRVELDDATLNEEKYELAPTALQLNEAFVSIALSFGFTNPVLAAYKTSQSLIQSIPPDSPPLLQLPHFDLPTIEKIEDAAQIEARRNLSVQAFMNFPEQRRRELVKNAGLSPQQYETAITVAKQLPRLVVERTFFKVHGEKYIIPSSLVQFVVKARFIPPGTENVPDVKPADLEDIDVEEFDSRGKRRTDSPESKQHQPPLAHAPYFPRDHSPRWHLFLADSRQGKIAVPPFTFTTFDKAILDDQGKPTFNVQTLKMQFQAPPQPGQYKFQMQLLCDSYLGFDEKKEVVLTLDEPSKAEEVAEDDDISEPEEDSIAGQMAALRGAPTASDVKPKSRRKQVTEESDSESGTDEDEDTESETDTDTDTDEE